MNNSKILDEAIRHGREEQHKELRIDLDSVVKERSQKPIKIEFKGRTFEVPPTTPMWYETMVLDKMDQIKSISDEEIEGMSPEEIQEVMSIDHKHNKEVLIKLLGKGFVDECMKSNWIDMSTLNKEVLRPIVQKWGWMPIEDTTKKKKNPDS